MFALLPVHVTPTREIFLRIVYVYYINITKLVVQLVKKKKMLRCWNQSKLDKMGWISFWLCCEYSGINIWGPLHPKKGFNYLTATVVTSNNRLLLAAENQQIKNITFLPTA